MLATPRDDQIGTRRDSGGNDLFVIDIADRQHRSGILVNQGQLLGD